MGTERRFAVSSVLSLAVHVTAGLAFRPGRPSTTRGVESLSAPLAGETFDPREALDITPPEPVSDGPERPFAPQVAPPPRVVSTADRPRVLDARGGRRASPPGTNPRSSVPGGPPGRDGDRRGAPLFGAVGVRHAVDLPTAFARTFPQVASADAGWAHVRVGSRQSATLLLEMDHEGAIRTHHLEGAPESVMRRGVERTLGLLQTRVFVARSLRTKLVLTTRVSADEHHDGLHGDVFALSGGTFDGRRGRSFFALPIGRRIDLEIELAD